MPDVFVQFCQWFHQDVFVLYPSMDLAISAFVEQLDDESKVTLRAYLADLIASSASDQEWERLWKDHGAQFGWVESSSMRPFFAEIQRVLTGSR
jgi:contact-dependent growth inhibition (CDI) system CdiI-like immunity protein